MICPTANHSFLLSHRALIEIELYFIHPYILDSVAGGDHLHFGFGVDVAILSSCLHFYNQGSSKV